MVIIWDEEENNHIESWYFPEWWEDTRNYPTKETLKLLRQLQDG